MAWSPERRKAASDAAKARHAATVNPERQRPTRQAQNTGERRRRKPGTLNRMAAFKLDVFSEDQLDPNYVYRQVIDDGSRLRMVTKLDDYDFVNASEIVGFNPEAESDSEGGERIRWIVGQTGRGEPQYAYLLKKKREFWDEDNRNAMAFRDAQLTRRVFKGESSPDEIAARVVDGEGKLTTTGPDEADTSNTYVPPGVTLNHGLSGRRHGLVSPPA